MAEFATADGFVQFPVDERDVNGQTVRDVTIRTSGTEGKLIRITVWPEFADAEIEEGDWIAVDGVYEERTVGDKTYHNLNARRIAVNPGVSKSEPEVANRKGKKGSSF